MKKILLITTIIISLLVINKEDKVIIPDEAIRFRVIANSNDEFDQELKKKVVSNIGEVLTSILYYYKLAMSIREC